LKGAYLFSSSVAVPLTPALSPRRGSIFDRVGKSLNGDLFLRWQTVPPLLGERAGVRGTAISNGQYSCSETKRTLKRFITRGLTRNARLNLLDRPKHPWENPPDQRAFHEACNRSTRHRVRSAAPHLLSGRRALRQPHQHEPFAALCSLDPRRHKYS